MKSQVENFEDRILPYFFNTSGELCFLRLGSMMIMIVAWAGALYYGFADEPWEGIPGIIVPLIIIGFSAEVRFVVEQAGKEPTWGGLDPLGWATDYNGHPSSHRIKQMVSIPLACILMVVGTFREESSPGVMLVATSLFFVPFVFNILFELIERRGRVKQFRSRAGKRKIALLVREVPMSDRMTRQRSWAPDTYHPGASFRRGRPSSSPTNSDAPRNRVLRNRTSMEGMTRARAYVLP